MNGLEDELGRLKADHARLLAAFGAPDDRGFCHASISLATLGRWRDAGAKPPPSAVYQPTAAMSDARTETIDRRT